MRCGWRSRHRRDHVGHRHHFKYTQVPTCPSAGFPEFSPPTHAASDTLPGRSIPPTRPTESSLMSTARRHLVLFALATLLPFTAVTGSARPDKESAKEKPREDSKDLSSAVKKQLDADYSDLEALYKHLHTNPELSLR